MEEKRMKHKQWWIALFVIIAVLTPIFFILVIPYFNLENRISAIDQKIESTITNMNGCRDKTIVLNNKNRTYDDYLETLILRFMPLDYYDPRYTHKVVMTCNKDYYVTLEVDESMLDLAFYNYKGTKIDISEVKLQRDTEAEQAFPAGTANIVNHGYYTYIVLEDSFSDINAKYGDTMERLATNKKRQKDKSEMEKTGWYKVVVVENMTDSEKAELLVYLIENEKAIPSTLTRKAVDQSYYSCNFEESFKRGCEKKYF